MKVLVTGGAGFIGCNAAKRYMDRGDRVVVLDNLSRRGSERNLEWLRSQGQFEFERCDIRHAARLTDVLSKHQDTDVVLHLAAQVAVTTSVTNPRDDFEINALGTFNVLEAVRAKCPDAIVLYSSTNKVYGGLEHLGVREINNRYELSELPLGVSEAEPLDFHSPYGCSKGAADQYVRDYARIYGLRTVSLRQSCIYGYRQFGIEDQGWVAWFTIAAVLGRAITVYGDGKQSRDILFVDDLCAAYDAAVDNIERATGQVYNIGGGPENRMSLLELIQHLDRLTGRKLEVKYSKPRPGDQPVFVCNVQRAERELNWRPTTDISSGIEKLHDWVQANRNLFE